MTRAEFSKRTKLAAWERAKGCCEECDVKIVAGFGPEYDHVLEAWLGGDASLENCKVLCIPCHRLKTKARRPEVDKTRRIREKHLGIRKRKGPGFKGWRKFDGTAVWR